VTAVVELPPQPSGEITRSPTFRVADRQLEAAKIAVVAAKAERAPTVRLALTSGWGGIDPPATFSTHLGASYDGAISVPIFQGGLVRAHIDEAQATQHAALAQLRQTELDLKRDLADSLARYRGAREQLKLLGPAQTTADDAFALDWTRFLGGGNVTLFEVLDAYQSAQTLRLQRLDNEFSVRQAAAQAALILGEPR
jgi:multidrug efflux system outer membrane protein